MRAALALILLAGLPPQEPATPARIDFDRQILPLLSDNCFYCHGPDAGRRKGKLRLDVEKDAKKPNADGVAAIVPGKSAESELVRRILAADPDDLMPPVDSHKKFCDDLALPFDLIADPDKKIHAAYGFNGYTRALILVGKDGKIAYVNKKFDLKEEGWAELMRQVEALKPVK